MKKIIILATMLFTVAIPARSQKLLEFGVKAGITTDNLKIGKGKVDEFGIVTDSKVGGLIGAFGRVNVLAIHFQPEIIYTMNRYRMTAVSEEQRANSTVKINSLQLPVLVGFRIPFIRFQAGPVFNLKTDTSVKTHTKNVPVSVTTDKPAVSYILGVGLDLSKVNLDFRYNGQFKRYEQTVVVNPMTEAATVKSRDRVWMFTVGYLF